MGGGRALSSEDTAADVVAGMADAQATIANVWRNADGEMRQRAMRALRALISAEATLKAADDFLLAKTPAERAATFEALKAVACLRVGHDIKPLRGGR